MLRNGCTSDGSMTIPSKCFLAAVQLVVLRMGKVSKTVQRSNSLWRRGLYLLLFLLLYERMGFAAAQLTSNTSSTATDLDALEDFRQSFSSANLTTVLTNWTGSTFCNWFGVTCNSGSRVIQLNLPAQRLTGNIPPSLQNLTSLEQLDLQRNSFSGPIPTFIGNFSNLIHLDLSQNQLSGRIPPFSSFSTLQHLDLHENRLTGPIPSSFGSFSGLIHLNLSVNSLSGSIPPLSSFSSQQYLDLHGNFFSGVIPLTFGNFSRLILLDLSQNRLNGSIPPLISFSTLEYLDLHRNNFSGPFQTNVGNFSTLRHLNLGENSLSGSLPTKICELSSATLEFLSFARNNLSGSLPWSDGLDSCLNLTGLYLGGNLLSGDVPNSFEALVNLQTLDLSFNQLTGTIPRLPKGLTTATLKENRLTGNLSKQLGHFPDSLKLLSLSRNSLEDEIPAEIGKLANLTKLELNDNNFRGFIPDTWQQSSPLDTLDLSNNNLTGAIPPSIANLTQLNILKLDRNSLSGSIPASIGNLSQLITINLAENQLIREIPPEIVNLLRVTVLNLSWNDLSGIAPSGLFNLEQWLVADVLLDHNPKLRLLMSGSPAPAPVSSGGRSSDSSSHSRYSIPIIYVIDGLLALLNAYGLYAYFTVARAQEEKDIPISEPSTESEDTVTLDDVRRMTNNFHEDSIIGRGARSLVYRGIVGGAQVAVKVLKMENAEKGRETLIRELQTLGRVRHRNVLKILAVCADLETRALVLEYMPFSSLDRFLYKMVGRACLSWDTRFNILVGVAQGMAYLHREHQEPIIHCDLKPSNILLDSDFEPKVADFGIAKYVQLGSSIDASMSGLCGTIGYIPPEYAWTASASTKGDVFSFGIVLLELLTARKPYEGWDVEQGQPESLVEFVTAAYPDKIMNILDPNLVMLELDADLHQKEVKKVLYIGLICTAADPKSRPDMTDVLRLLTDIKLSRHTNGEGRRYRGLAELAQLPTLWESEDDPATRIFQESEETNLENWIARRMP